MKTLEQVTAQLDSSKKDKRRIGQRLRHAQNTGEHINLYVGTCPDYSHDGSRYTFETVGMDVPLLTQKQLHINQNLLQSLSCLWHSL